MKQCHIKLGVCFTTSLGMGLDEREGLFIHTAHRYKDARQEESKKQILNPKRQAGGRTRIKNKKLKKSGSKRWKGSGQILILSDRITEKKRVLESQWAGHSGS